MGVLVTLELHGEPGQKPDLTKRGKEKSIISCRFNRHMLQTTSSQVLNDANCASAKASPSCPAQGTGLGARQGHRRTRASRPGSPERAGSSSTGSSCHRLCQCQPGGCTQLPPPLPPCRQGPASRTPILPRQPGAATAGTRAHGTAQSSCTCTRCSSTHSSQSTSPVPKGQSLPLQHSAAKKLNLHPNHREMFAARCQHSSSGCTSHGQGVQNGVSSTEIPLQHHPFLT